MIQSISNTEAVSWRFDDVLSSPSPAHFTRTGSTTNVLVTRDAFEPEVAYTNQSTMGFDLDPVTASDDALINALDYALPTPAAGPAPKSAEHSTVELIKAMIIARDEHEVSELEGQIPSMNRSEVLACIIRDRKQLINVRAHAAKLLFSLERASDALFDEFKDHPSKMIRLGTMLGLADREDEARLGHFTDDESEAIAEEAKEILEDVGFE